MQLNSFPPFLKQQEFLSQMCKMDHWDGILIGHFVSGRGGGKTHAAIFALLWSCTTGNPGRYHLWTEATNQDCKDIFLASWKRIVPNELYTYKLNPIDITMVNGSIIHVRSRQTTNSNSEPFRGPEYCFAGHDEIAKDKTGDIWNIAMPVVRDTTSRRKMIIGTTTPKLGWYKEVALDPNSVYVHSTSYDNPYLDEQVTEQVKSQYSPEFAKQEIYAEWVAQSGRAWPHYNEEMWPNGNLHWHKYDSREPYILGVDFGVRSGYLLLQNVPARDTQNRQWDRYPLDVAVAEYTPNNEGTQQTIARINEQYGQPSLIICGHDLNTRSEVDLNTHVLMIKEIGWNCRIMPITGVLMNKEMQHYKSEGTILTDKGFRRFCVSEHLVSHDAENRRGIREVLLNDTWPDGVPKAGEHLPKDKATTGYEDMRDAWQYAMVGLHPPRAHKRGSLPR